MGALKFRKLGEARLGCCRLSRGTNPSFVAMRRRQKAEYRRKKRWF